MSGEARGYNELDYLWHHYDKDKFIEAYRYLQTNKRITYQSGMEWHRRMN
jgi:hypothetical protein